MLTELFNNNNIIKEILILAIYSVLGCFFLIFLRTLIMALLLPLWSLFCIIYSYWNETSERFKITIKTFLIFWFFVSLIAKLYLNITGTKPGIYFMYSMGIIFIIETLYNFFIKKYGTYSCANNEPFIIFNKTIDSDFFNSPGYFSPFVIGPRFCLVNKGKGFIGLNEIDKGNRKIGKYDRHSFFYKDFAEWSIILFILVIGYLAKKSSFNNSISIEIDSFLFALFIYAITVAFFDIFGLINEIVQQVDFHFNDEKMSKILKIKQTKILGIKIFIRKIFTINIGFGFITTWVLSFIYIAFINELLNYLYQSGMLTFLYK